MISYLSTFTSWYRLLQSGIFTANMDLVLVAFGGVVANFIPGKVAEFGYQFIVLGLINAYMGGYISW